MKRKYKWYQTLWIEMLLTLPFSLAALIIWYYSGSLLYVYFAIGICFILGLTRTIETIAKQILLRWYK